MSETEMAEESSEASEALEREKDHLAVAERHIAEAHIRIAQQQRLIAELVRDHHPTELARRLLETMLVSLREMESHLSLIKERLRYLTEARSGSGL
jgi:hypothetical protein